VRKDIHETGNLLSANGATEFFVCSAIALNRGYVSRLRNRMGKAVFASVAAGSVGETVDSNFLSARGTKLR
jgi:hypothetical protein